MKAVSTAIFLRVVTKILMCTIRELSLGLGLCFSIERYKYIWETIIHMPCVWNTFSDSDHNSNFIFSYYVTIFLDLMKFFRCDIVIRSLMGRTETVCFDNYEQIWVCKNALSKANHGGSGLSDGRTGKIWKQTFWHPKHIEYICI